MTPTSPSTSDNQQIKDLTTLCLYGMVYTGFLGAIVNAINGLISPLYFRLVMNWKLSESLYRMIIAQGIYEGILFGLVFSLIFVIGAVFITSGKITLKEGKVRIFNIIKNAFNFWILGGILGIMLACLSPNIFLLNRWPNPPENYYTFSDTIRFAWVKGSIMGIELGGFVCLVINLLNLWTITKNQQQSVVQNPVKPAE